MIYRFGSFELDEERFELRRRSKVVAVQRRVLETILFLVKSGGRLVTKDDLTRGPWQGAVVSDAAFGQAIMLARRALADGKEGPFVVTVRGKGFRFELPSGAGRHDRPWAVDDVGPAPAPSSGAKRLAADPQSQPVPSSEPSLVRQGSLVADGMIAVARRRGDPARLLDALLWRAQHLLELGERTSFIRATSEHQRLALETRHPMHLWYSKVLASTRCHQEAKIGAAVRHITANLPLGMKTVGPAVEGAGAVHLLNLAFEMRGPLRAKALRRALILARRCARRERGRFIWRSLSAVTCLQLGDPIRSRSLFQGLRGELPGLAHDALFLPSLVNVIDLLVAFRDWERLRQVYDRMLPHQGVRVCIELSDWGPVSFHLGRASRELGEAGASHRHFTQAIAESDAAGAICWKAWAQYACARALADTGQRADARRAVVLLRKTAETARRIDAGALRQASSSLGQPPSPVSFLLTTSDAAQDAKARVVKKP